MKYKPMNPEAKAKWVAALRSGNYVQGDQKLYVTGNEDVHGEGLDRHCCLGVLQEVLGFPLDEASQPNNTLLLPAAARAAGLSVARNREYGDVSDSNVQKQLAMMNSRGDTFEQIADWVEANL